MVYDFERNKIRQQEVEVKALIALAEFGHTFQVDKALARLHEIAHTELLAEKINKDQTKLEYQ